MKWSFKGRDIIKQWMLKQTKVDVSKMAKRLGVGEIICRVLANRGINTYNDAVRFLNPKLNFLHDTTLMKDVSKSLEILAKAIANGDKIAVYGDYDVDGVASVTILIKSLKACGANVVYYMPHRQAEGYGLNKSAIETLKDQGVGLVLTCDNGISALQEIAHANGLDMEVIVLDHHEPGTEDCEELLPPAVAIVDPKQRGCEYPFKELCAAGISYKFAEALFKFMDKPFTAMRDELLAFAAIATICDIVELKCENRIIAKNGLSRVAGTSNLGLKALLEASNIADKQITAYHAGFILGPCINACGRLESSDTAVRLFLTEDEKEAQKLADEMILLNATRKGMTEAGTEQIVEIIEEKAYKEDKVIVVYDDGVHESIAGIIAGRVKDAYYKPTIVITGGEQCAKGSARSIDGYNVFEALNANKHLFERFGGHAMAAGLSLKEENIGILRACLNEQCTLSDEDYVPKLRIDKELKMEDLTGGLTAAIEKLAPFGKGNHEPLFATRNIIVNRADFIGANKNIIKFAFTDEKSGRNVTGICFKGYEKFIEMLEDTYGKHAAAVLKEDLPLELDIVYYLRFNEYNGNKTMQLVVEDFRMA